MKIVGLVNALNEEELLEVSLRSKLKFCDRYVVVEGPVVGHVAPLRGIHSNDRTLEILDELSSEYSNLIVVKPKRKWKSKQEQQNEWFRYVDEGDWCLLNGIDELWEEGIRGKLEWLIKSYPDDKEFIFPMLNMVNGATQAIMFEETGSMKYSFFDLKHHHQRFYKYQEGMKYINHPTVNDKMNRDTYFNYDYMHCKRYVPTIPYFHYCYCADMQNQIRKRIYYEMRYGQSLENSIKHVKLKLDVYGCFWKPLSRGYGVFDWDKNHPLKGFSFKDKMCDVDWESLRKELSSFNETPMK